MMYEVFLQLVDLVKTFGYLGIFIMTFIESTFAPIPSEVTLIPAGFLVSQGEMNFFVVLFVSVLGTIGGSLFNYWIASHFGRRLLLKFGKYFFINEDKLKSIEFFFERHGAISTFSGRLLPGIKHFISFPAGLGRMNLRIFTIYTLAGGFIWNSTLLTLGYLIGENKALLKQYIKQINIVIIITLTLVALLYYFKNKKKTS